MYTRRAMLLGAGAACVRGTLASASETGGTQVLTASDGHVTDYPTVEAIRWMGKMIEREAGGKLSLRVYHSGQLGRENDTVDLARLGALDITRINFASLNNPFPATQVMSLPTCSIPRSTCVAPWMVLPGNKCSRQSRSAG
jgi:TRAP-type C4-dicarboxylate transport system substrate-binding protein